MSREEAIEFWRKKKKSRVRPGKIALWYLQLASDFADHQTKSLKEENKELRDNYDRIRNMSAILLERLDKRKPVNDYIFSVRIAINDLEKSVEEAEKILSK